MAGGGDGRDVEHVGDEIVVRVERCAAVAGRPTALKKIRRRAQMNVGIDERTAAPSGTLHDRHLAEGPDVEKALGVLPEPPFCWIVPVARELAAAIAPSALQNRNAELGLRQTASRDRAAEAAADNDRVVTRSHRSPFDFAEPKTREREPSRVPYFAPRLFCHDAGNEAREETHAMKRPPRALLAHADIFDGAPRGGIMLGSAFI